MSAEMPVRVEPAAGATRVEFPWDAASDAVDALVAASRVLDQQLDTRERMVGTLDEWNGIYRGDFERANGRISDVAVGLKDELARLASSIVTAAEDANQQQRNDNTIAENVRSGAIPPLGGRA